MSITLKNICFSYNAKEILQNFSMTLEEGQPLAIIGSSGCGKSTLLHIIAGLKLPTSGSILGISDFGCSMVFQEDRLLENLTVYDNLKFVCSDLTHERAEFLLRQVGLEGEIDLYPSALSGGMRRRVAIVRAIIFGRSPIIMDEPFSGLDPTTKKRVMDFIKINVKDKIFIFSTHDPNDAEYFNAKIAEIKLNNN